MKTIIFSHSAATCLEPEIQVTLKSSMVLVNPQDDIVQMSNRNLLLMVILVITIQQEVNIFKKALELISLHMIRDWEVVKGQA